MPASSFYVAQTRWSDPGPFGEIVASWGGDPVGIASAAAAVLRHPWDPHADPGTFTSAQQQDRLLRSSAEILATAQRRRAASTGAEGDLARRVGGVCRDFALLAVTALRQRGTPARLRVGFADYLNPGWFEDHWVCEWHDRARWRRLDVQWAARTGAGRAAGFDPTDVPRDRFVPAAAAWRMTGAGAADAARFGVSVLGLTGRAFLAASLLRDEAAVMRLELKPWDVWGAALEARALPAEALSRSAAFGAAADRLAAVDAEDADGAPDGFDGWQPPATVTSYPLGTPLEVRLA